MIKVFWTLAGKYFQQGWCAFPFLYFPVLHQVHYHASGHVHNINFHSVSAFPLSYLLSILSFHEINIQLIKSWLTVVYTVHSFNFQHYFQINHPILTSVMMLPLHDQLICQFDSFIKLHPIYSLAGTKTSGLIERARVGMWYFWTWCCNKMFDKFIFIPRIKITKSTSFQPGESYKVLMIIIHTC